MRGLVALGKREGADLDSLLQRFAACDFFAAFCSLHSASSEGIMGL